eukprot:TRINITY_DN1590_c0_g2_i2.p1 TRINITY_DN1590_c0_g2~~TRINITY_DN1590_c0_g2_i2.p1  ORF type:complete len:553 (-),score=167.50 TRINITY_DN1590_c0_g2_i2:168-1826(-)
MNDPTAGDDGEISAMMVLLFFGIVAMYTFLETVFEHFNIQFFHQSGVAIILGGILGYVAKMNNQKQEFSFDGTFFFTFVLPAILFSAGYNLKKRRFVQNFNYIVLYGVLGTIVNFAVMVAGTYLVSSNNLISVGYLFGENKGKPAEIVQLTIPEIFFMSATLCSSDTVAALTMIKSKEHPKLFSLVFGEGIVNDAVAIILFNAVRNTISSNAFHWYTPVNLSIDFFKMSGLSVLVGILTGIVAAICFKKSKFISTSPIVEICLVFFFGYSSYLIAELFHYSGVIALLIAGIVLAHYNWYNLSDYGKFITGYTFQSISTMAEGFLFAYLGISSLFYIDKEISLSFIGYETIVVLVARFAAVYVLSGIGYLKMKQKWKVDFYELAIIWFSGLIRGAIAFALVIQIDGIKNKNLVLTTTLGIVLITTIGLGAIMPKFIAVMLRLKSNAESNRTSLEIPIMSRDQAVSGREEEERKLSEETMSKDCIRILKDIDNKIVKRMLIRDYEKVKEELNRKKKLKINEELALSQPNKSTDSVHHQEPKFKDQLVFQEIQLR